MANGYFQLVNKENATYIKVIMPTQGGMPVGINEVMEYLAKHSIPYDLSLLHSEMKKAEAAQKGQFLVLLSNQPFRLLRETYELMVSYDKMSAAVRFYPPSEGGERIDYDEFKKDLAYQKIIHGIKDEVVRNIVKAPQYCTDVVIAEGTPARHGCDAKIEYYFETDLKVKPTILEDHTVDFFNLNIINHCKKGDVLARLIPEDKGDPGTDIMGGVVKPRNVERKKLRYGNNIILAEDGLTISSDVDGHVSLVDDQVFVANVLTFENIDTSTGNIDFEGSIQVNGNIAANFTVKAKGNIEVKGVVEGAYLEAGDDIILARGMNGMNRGKLVAGGNIIAKFIENGSAAAGGYISAGAILHSDVIAGTEITVDGKKGFITGGHVSATDRIEVKTLGSAMGANTIVEVGVDPTVKKRMNELQIQITELSKAIKNNQPILNTMAQKIAKGVKINPEQIQYIKRLAIENQRKVEEQEQLLQELTQLQTVAGQKQQAEIIVNGEVYAGTKIGIGDISMVVRSTVKYCRFRIVDGDIKMTGI